MRMAAWMLVSALIWSGAGRAEAATCKLPDRAAEMRQEVIASVNYQRKAAGLAPLAAQAALERAAQDHACDNAATGRMSHAGSDGSTLPQRLKRVGYAFRAASENVAEGFMDAPSVMAGWMGSKGHRRNILDRGVAEIGIGLALGRGGTVFWTMDLGASR